MAVLFVVKILLQVLEPFNGTNNMWTKDRIRQSLRALDQCLRQPPGSGVVLFLGTSEIEVGFDPRIFDRTLNRSTETLNLAVRNVGNFMPLYLARVRQEFLKHSAKADVIFLHMPISRMTKRARNSASEGNKTHDLPTVYFDQTVAGNFEASAYELGFFFFNKYFLGERSLSQMTYLLRRPLRGWMAQQGAAATARIDLWNRADLHPQPAWEPKTRGHFYWNLENEGAMLQGVLQAIPPETALRSSIAFQKTCCDFVDLNIDWQYVEQVRTSLIRLKEVTRHLILIHLPEHPGFKRSEDSLINMALVLKRLRQDTGVELWETQMYESYGPEHFIDVVHFSPLGVRHFSEELAKSAIDLLPTE
ncbi:MAG: hypothetical protein AB7N80_12865 [Bdellovibrionales bacterium]